MKLTASCTLVIAMGCVPALSTSAARQTGIAPEPVTGTPPGLPLGDDEQWHLTLFHVHTEEGSWRYSERKQLKERTIYDAEHARMVVRLAAARTIKVVVFTDHNSLEPAFDKELRKYAQNLGVTLLAGSEWSLGGPLLWNMPVTPGVAGPHAALIGYSAARARDVLAPSDTRVRGTLDELKTIVEATHERGGVAVLAHPEAFNSNYPYDDADVFDLVEVDGPRLERPTLALARWHKWLMAGQRIGAISSANWHVGMYRDEPYEHLNLVRAAHRTTTELTDALRHGHVMIVQKPWKQPRVLLGADGDGDGSFDDVREGDVLIPRQGMSRVRFQVRVVGAEEHTLVLYGASSTEPMLVERLHKPEVVRAFSLPLSTEKRTFVRAELWQGMAREVLTNPLYFDPVPASVGVVDASMARPVLDPQDEPQDPIRIITTVEDAGNIGVSP